MEMKSLKQFADEHGITLRAAQRHIQKHEDELEGHIVRHGPPRGTFIDEFAIEYLSGLIVGPPVTFVSATQEASELRDELEESQKKILALTEKLAALLEDKATLTERALQAEGTLALSEASVATKEATIQDLRNQVDKLKGRTLWQRITRWGE